MPLTCKQKWLWGFTIVILIKFVIVGMYFAVQGWLHPHYTQAQLKLPDNSLITVEVADSWREQEHGLMGRESLVADAGMLFVFDRPAKYPFWMKDTKIDLDYVWMLEGTVVDLSAQVPAGDGLPKDQIAQVTPKIEVDWVLEVPAGFIAEHQLQVGDQLVLSDNRLDETPSVF